MNGGNTPGERSDITALGSNILLMLVFPLLLISFASSVVSTGRMERSLKESMAETMVDLSRDIGMDMMLLLESMEDGADILAGSVGASFRPDMAGQEEYLREFRNSHARALLTTARSNSSIHGVYFMSAPAFGDPPGQIWYYRKNGQWVRGPEYPLPQHMDPENPDMKYYYHPLREGKAYWSDLYRDLDINVEMFSYTVPVYPGAFESNGNEAPIGVVGIDIAAGDILETIREYRVHTSGHAFLMTENISIYPEEESPPGRLSEASWKQLRRVIFDPENQRSAHFLEFAADGENHLVGYSRLQNSWVLGVIASETEVYADIGLTWFTVLSINGMAIFFSIIFSLFIVRYINTPLQVLSREMRKVRNDHRYIVPRIPLYHRKDEIGELYRTFSGLQRITAESLNRLIEENIAQERLASMGEQLAGFAHEIQTPIGNINLAVSSLRQGMISLDRDFQNQDLTKTQFSEFIGKSNEMLGSLVWNINQVRRVVQSIRTSANAQLNMQLEKFFLKEIIETTYENSRYSRKSMDVELRLEISEDLEIASYPGLLIQVFSNLIQNSILHGFRNRNGGNIRIAAEHSGSGEVEILYCDDGEGIPREFQNQIFTRFFTTAKSRGGTGLGLSIIDAIIRDMLEGSIRFVDRNETGVCFQIVLPEELKGGRAGDEKKNG
ncbi:sensor histidine kinase [Salinispira pacifica]|uniref:histidine kinase n=1 Tax=Salinispira pacifica TaxID=1307761 RepID=V5WKM2_9SPIO|nr:sensor histidine kinase [Salinispira pacifica]AHC16089.1 Signal transduction histidine kinase [Salinispira pacifica]